MGGMTAVAISPDGSWLATAGADKRARVWAADGTARATLTGHRGRVTAVAISPDGSWLATASWDTTARIWVADAAPRHRHSWWSVPAAGTVTAGIRRRPLHREIRGSFFAAKCNDSAGLADLPAGPKSGCPRKGSRPPEADPA
jgi:WD domain, G-beta repeat